MRKTALLTLILLLRICIQTLAQTDTLFWFAAPDVYQTPQNLDRPVRLRITAYAQPAAVTISQPAGGGMPVQNVNVAANSTQTVDLTNWINNVKNTPPNTVLNYGLKVISTQPVTVYYESLSQGLNSPETFVLKGTNALGNDFWIPAQNLVDNNATPYYAGAYSSFDIVATQNNTNVTITPSNAIVGHPAGTPFNITLNAGQTWSAVATSKLATQHLQGSRVVADKPVAITIKDDEADGRSNNLYGPCADLIGDQIVPVDLLGTEYIAVNGFLDAPHDQLFILATQNGTTISQNGVLVATINAGQTHRLVIGGHSTYIQTSAPAYVLQLTGTGCEMGLGQLPSINCTGSFSVSYTRSLTANMYANIVVQNGGQSTFLVNGNTGVINAAHFYPVPGTSGQWYAAQVMLPLAQYPQGGVISITNALYPFHLGVLDGGGGGTSYGYFSDFRRVSVTAGSNGAALCAGTELRLSADTITAASYTWTGPNGFSSNQQNPLIPNVTVADSGMYIVTANTYGCIVSDTVAVPIFYLPVADLGPDTANCGDTILLQSSPVYTDAVYRWSTGASSHTFTVTQPGVYWLEIDNNGCKGRDTVNVTLNPALEVDLGNDTALCDVDVPLILYSSQPAGTQYLWSTGLVDSQAAIYQTGTYWLYVNRDGCRGSDTIHVRVVQTPVISLGNDTVICESIPVRIGIAVPGATYSWNTGSSLAYTEVDTTGLYVLSVNLEGCVVHDTIHITAMPDPPVDLGPDDDICPDQTIVLDASMSANDDYLWNTGDTMPAISVISGGMYWVEVISEYGCTGRDSITLSYHPKPMIMLGADTTVCEETPLLLSPRTLNTDSVRWSDGSVGAVLSVKYGGQYIATGVNKCGTGSDTVVVKQLFCDIWVPNAFTPNGDGINDVFRILGNTGRMNGVSFGIYNRWGEQIFHTKDKYQGWDGNYKGSPALMGTYVYSLEYNIDGRPYLQKGNFHLLR